MSYYPTDIAKMAGWMTLYEVDEDFSPAGPTVLLPIPQNLVYADRATYENADIGFTAEIKDKVLNGANEGEGLLAKARSQVENLSIGNASEMALNVTTRVMGNRTRYLAGRTPNPNTRALFKQMNLREFSFAFKFLPVSREESNNVKEIIKILRTGMHPNTDGSVKLDKPNGTQESLAAIYEMPNRFQIDFFLGGIQVEPKLQPAVLTTLNLSYNNSQTAILNDGGEPEFSEIDLSITFTEFKANTKIDIAEGY